MITNHFLFFEKIQKCRKCPALIILLNLYWGYHQQQQEFRSSLSVPTQHRQDREGWGQAAGGRSGARRSLGCRGTRRRTRSRRRSSDCAGRTPEWEQQCDQPADAVFFSSKSSNVRKIKSIQVSAQDVFFFHLIIRGFQKHPKVSTYLIKEHLDVQKKALLSILKSWSPWMKMRWRIVAKLVTFDHSGRGGHLGVAVLTCHFNCNFRAILAIRIIYICLVKKPAPSQIHLIKNAKHTIFYYLKIKNNRKCPALHLSKDLLTFDD